MQSPLSSMLLFLDQTLERVTVTQLLRTLQLREPTVTSASLLKMKIVTLKLAARQARIRGEERARETAVQE